ncbi:MAG: hypothetical protein HQ596_01510 [Candidatus Saganbacteria bacterium]|nr:hypothetical protein [Candidatus Saganbacteria bacterium]
MNHVHIDPNSAGIPPRATNHPDRMVRSGEKLYQIAADCAGLEYTDINDFDSICRVAALIQQLNGLSEGEELSPGRGLKMPSQEQIRHTLQGPETLDNTPFTMSREEAAPKPIEKPRQSMSDLLALLPAEDGPETSPKRAPIRYAEAVQQDKRHSPSARIETSVGSSYFSASHNDLDAVAAIDGSTSLVDAQDEISKPGKKSREFRMAERQDRRMARQASRGRRGRIVEIEPDPMYGKRLADEMLAYATGGGRKARRFVPTPDTPKTLTDQEAKDLIKIGDEEDTVLATLTPEQVQTLIEISDGDGEDSADGSAESQ